MRIFLVLAVVAALALAAGCGDKGTGGTTTTTTSGPGTAAGTGTGGDKPAPSPGPSAPSSAASGSLVGTWAPDVAAVRTELEKFAAAQLEAMRGSVPADQFEQMKKEMLEGMMAEFEDAEQARLVVNADGTFVMYEEEGGDAVGKGTWKLEGTTITIHQSEEDGETLEEPKVMTARLENGEIRMRPDESMPFDIVFRRK